jgi:hypothetical protein
MRWRLLPYLIGPVVVAGLVFHWNARAARWTVWHVDPWCAYGVKASYYDYLRSRTVEKSELDWLTHGADPNNRATTNLLFRTVVAFGAAVTLVALFRRYGPPLRSTVIPPDPTPGALK